jgi:hypothetical protein
MSEESIEASLTIAEAEELLRKAETDVVVLPSAVRDDGLGLYDDSLIDLVKELKAEGVDAAYAHTRDQRSWTGKKSFTFVAGSIAIGIVSSAGWEGIRLLLLRQKPRSSLTMKLARAKAPDGTQWDWYELTGTGQEIATMMAELNPPPNDNDREA